MIRIDHITDPLGFVLSMAFCSAAELTPSSLAAMITLAPVVAARALGSGPARQGARPTRPTPRPPDAGVQPSPA